jgi:predicted GIY-YIG superfamily endonuclease
MSGYVYLLKCQDFYKIGIATDVHKRISGMQTGSPHTISLVASVEVDNPLALEKELHAMYSHRHHRREWFALTEEDVEAIRSMFTGSKVAGDASQPVAPQTNIWRMVGIVVSAMLIFGVMLFINGRDAFTILPAISMLGFCILGFWFLAIRAGLIPSD